VSPAPRRAPDRRGRVRRRWRRLGAWALRLAAVLLAFAIGVAVGEALNDNPQPGGDITSVRTLKPLPVAPARETVTVTATSP
jgi:hypothetical protein